MFINSKAPFYRFARIIRLGYLEEKPLIDSLSSRFLQFKINLHEDYASKIVQLTKSHPYYTQLAFQQIILLNALLGNPPNLDELLSQMLAVEKDYLEKVWEDISNNREYVYTLRTIAEDSKNIYKRLKPQKINVGRAIKKLEGMGFLFRDKITGYYISDPLLQQWIINKL